MEDRRITYAVSNFSNSSDGDDGSSSQDGSGPATRHAGGTPTADAGDAPPDAADAAGHGATGGEANGGEAPDGEAPDDDDDAPVTAAADEADPIDPPAAPVADIAAAEIPATETPATGTGRAPTASAAPPTAALPAVVLQADDAGGEIDEARLRSALALRRLPVSPRQFYTRQRANAVSLLGIIAAIGAAGWYVSNNHNTEPKVVEIRNKGAVKSASFISAKPLAPALYTVPLPKIDRKVLLSLGALEYRAEPSRYIRVLRVQKGDTFSEVLTRVGVPASEARSAIGAMRTIFDPRKLRPGLKLAVTFGTIGDEQSRFLGVSFDSSFDKTVQVQRQRNGEFVSAELKKDLDVGYARSNGEIKSSLFQAALNAKAPASAIVQMIHLFSFAVDFQRDIREGDKFEILYRVQRDRSGKVVRTGEVAYASLSIRGTVHKLYRFQPKKNGPATYLNEKGEGNRKALLKTPVDGARLSSSFGMRRHPILGFSRMHTGTDFAAPRGTPIYAGGDGTVIKAGWSGGYGNYVRIRHNKEYMTAYGHMSKILVRVGQRVKQGQTIGLVGSTGRSTGPHVHYEVLRYGKFINSQTMTLPSFHRLRGTELAHFKANKAKIDAIYAALGKSGVTGRLLTVKANPDGGCKNGIRLDPTDTRPCE